MVLEDLFKEPSAMARFRTPPLGPEMDAFCEWLTNVNYFSPPTTNKFPDSV
jgi:hypothetical protein